MLVNISFPCDAIDIEGLIFNSGWGSRSEGVRADITGGGV